MRSLRLRLSALLTAIMILFLTTYASAAKVTPTPSPSLPPFDDTVAAYDPERPENLTPDQIYAQSFILINQDDGRVLMEKNADVRMNPASVTKIMTLIVAVENGGNLSEIVRVPQEAKEIPSDSSVVPVEVGEEMTILDLLYGMMLRSGNDAANAVAVVVGGSVDNFVRMMNAKAQALGCTGTHFVNAHGYTVDDHYTTARDLAIITRAALQNNTIRRIVSTGQYTMAPTNLREEYVIQNSNLLVVYGSEFRYSGAYGVKTGTTSAAGQCLVSAAEKNDIRLICVGLKSTTAFQNAKWQDAKRLLDFGFSRYRTYTFKDLYDMLNITVPISGGDPSDPSNAVIRLNALITSANTFERTIHVDDLDDLLTSFKDHMSIEYSRDLKAPIETGTVIGRLNYTDEAGEVISAVLISDRDVAAAPSSGENLLEELISYIPQWVYWVLLGLAALIVLIIVLRIIAVIRRARRRARIRKRARRLSAQRRRKNSKT